jgi:hypothetical protein
LLKNTIRKNIAKTLLRVRQDEEIAAHRSKQPTQRSDLRIDFTGFDPRDIRLGHAAEPRKSGLTHPESRPNRPQIPDRSKDLPRRFGKPNHRLIERPLIYDRDPSQSAHDEYTIEARKSSLEPPAEVGEPFEFPHRLMALKLLVCDGTRPRLPALSQLTLAPTRRRFTKMWL